jgi:YegS/Rv2252/BmrU family lipid kinase
VALVERALARHGLSGVVNLTKAAGHGTELARQALADGCSPIVAWGGDGTINEVASQLAGSLTPFGIVRAGSGNGMARELGIPAAADRAIDIALGAREKVVDHGDIDGHPFLNVAGIGFDAMMARVFNGLGGERRGPLRYTVEVFRAAFHYEAVRYAIEADGRRLEVEALLVAIANLAQYGSNVVVAPGARPDDGLLDVGIIEGRGAMGRLGLAPRVFDRTIHKAAGVTLLRAADITVSCAGPIAFHVDGEPRDGGTTVRARIHPGSLTVRVPSLNSGRKERPACASAARANTSRAAASAAIGCQRSRVASSRRP